MTEDQKKYKPRPGGLTGVWPEVSKQGMKYYSGTCTREDLLTAMEFVDAQRDGDQRDDDKFKVLVWITDKKHARSPALSVELGTPSRDPAATETAAPPPPPPTVDENPF